VDESAWSFVWVVDAPMFERIRDDKGNELGWTAVHHPFTSPNEDWVDRFEEAPTRRWPTRTTSSATATRSAAVDPYPPLRPAAAGVRAAGHGRGGAAEKFGFLLDAFNYGPPPHGGIAIGWDRTCMLLTGADSLREVIAFPKSGGGFDPLTSAPAPITAEQRKEAGIDAKPEQPKPPAAARSGACCTCGCSARPSTPGRCAGCCSTSPASHT